MTLNPDFDASAPSNDIVPPPFTRNEWLALSMGVSLLRMEWEKDNANTLAGDASLIGCRALTRLGGIGYLGNLIEVFGAGTVTLNSDNNADQP